MFKSLKEHLKYKDTQTIEPVSLANVPGSHGVHCPAPGSAAYVPVAH